MKQKRKVKSLIPQKKFTSKSLKTAGLVFLGSALYLASITLLSTSVAFGANDGAQAQDFPEFDWTSPITDKKEVVYAARFATIDNLKTRIIDIFMNKDGVLYITPNPVIVNPLNENGNGIAKYNFVDTENKIYGHVLGGKDNYVYSNNVTIIAGEGNKVKTGSDNATMLGGENNTINQGNGVPSAIIGGSENEIKENHNGSNVIIGGKNNTIESRVSGSAILGGELNTIENNTSNAIIGGSNVNNNNQNNVFAYSNDGNFKPENPNSFFLNMRKGVGINMEASGALNGLYVSGAVSLGDINIKSKPCNNSHPDNYGLEGKYNGCLVGCTIDGWKMFDRGAKCEEICKENIVNNIFKECPRDAAIPDSPDDYTGFCMGLANTDNATQCPNLEAQMQNYKNVVFETKLIDSETVCPTNSEDKCIFRCEDDYNLRSDTAGGSNVKKCYHKCTLPWKDANENEIKIGHNDTVEAYNTDSVNCSNTAYIFPQNTAIVNVPISEYTTITNNGMLKAKNGYSYESCTNYTHKKTLVCKDGTLYIANSNGKATTKKALDKTGEWYGHKTCTTKDYTCPTDIYNLNKTYITNKNQGNDTVERNDIDRSTSIGVRGKYELCLDWTPSAGNSECKVGTNGANRTDSNFHYKLTKCQDNYERFNDKDVKDPKGNRCMQKCTFTTAEGKEITKSHNESVELFSSDNKTCPKVCEKKTFKCNDGKWDNETDMNTYKYSDCTLHSQEWDSSFDITETTFNGIADKSHSRYDNQSRSIAIDSKFNCEDQIKYKLIGCEDGYHTENKQYCVRDTNTYYCTRHDHSYRVSDNLYLPRSEKYGGYPQVEAGTYGNRWIGTWENGYRETRNLCDYKCIEGYRKDGDSCKKISDKCGSSPNTCDDPHAEKVELGHNNHKYEWTCQGNSCSACDEGYTEINGICEENIHGTCRNESTYPKVENGITTRSNQDSDLCIFGSPQNQTQDPSNLNQFTWKCKGSGNGNISNTCHKCVGGSTWDEESEKCVNPTPPEPDEPECGDATTKEYTDSSKNNINSEACNPGTLNGSITTNSNGTKFKRTCKNEDLTTSCETDRVACGTANGQSFTEQSFAELSTSALCTNGTARFNNSDTEFKRRCTKGNASVENCRATKVPSCEPTTCDSSYDQKSCPSGKGCSSCTATDSSCNSTTKYKVDCTINECSGYGLSSCPSGKECDSCNATDSNCNTSTKYKVKGDLCTPTTCDSSYDQKSCPSGKGCSSCTATDSSCNSTTKYKVDCTINECSGYGLSSCPDGKGCSSCTAIDSSCNSTTKYKVDCTINECSGYGLSSCPSGKTCDSCNAVDSNCNTSTKYKVTGCSATTHTYGNCSYEIPALSNGRSQTVINNANVSTYTGSTTAQCTNGELTYSNESCRKIENGQCKNNVLYGCETPSSSGIWIDNIIENDKIVGVLYECRGKDQTATCPFTCPDGKIFSGDSLHNGTCVTETCPAPTITGVEGRNVSFVLNGADANATMLIKTEDNENWPSGGDVSGTSSPRSLGSTPAKGYTKMRTLCKNGVWSTDSNVVEFETQMIIDSIEGCALKYHFDGNDPISGKSCCNPVRLDYSYDGVTFSPLTTTYKNGMSFASHGKEGKVYFRYSLDGGKSWSSTTSYNMSKQSCGSSSCSRTFYDGTQLNWVANGLYAEDGYKLAEISYWSAATSNNVGYNEPCRPITNNSNCTYNTHRRTLDSVTTYDCPDRTFYLSINDSATLYNAYRNHYNNTPTDKTIIYVPGADNGWCKLEMRIASANNGGGTWFNFYVDGVASHVGNLCR